MAIAKSDPNIENRKKALFWLGQKNDPRVKQFLRDLIKDEIASRGAWRRPLVVAAAASDAAAQSFASRVDAVRDGIVQMSFASRPGVCGDGNGSMWTQDNNYNDGFNRTLHRTDRCASRSGAPTARR